MICISVCDMRAADKSGYVAKLDGKERIFLGAKSYSNHGVSAKTVSYEIAEEAYGLYEICDANYGGRKRRIFYLAVAPHGWEEFDDLKAAESFASALPAEVPTESTTVAINEPVVTPTYPGLKSEAEKEAPEIDVEVLTCRLKDESFLQVKMKSDRAFKLFMPDMKNQVHGRKWNEASRSWLIPSDSVMLLRGIIEEYTIRTNGMRMEMSFKISTKSREMMAIDD